MTRSQVRVLARAWTAVSKKAFASLLASIYNAEVPSSSLGTRSMDNFEVISGLIGGVFSLLVLLFRRALAHSHFITVPKGFGGKSFVERFGEDKGAKMMAVFGVVMFLLSSVVLIAGLLGIELPRKPH